MKGTTMKILISLFFIFIGHHEFLNAQRTLPRPPRSNGEYSLTSSELIHTIILPQVHHDSLRQDDSLQNRSGRAGIGIVQSLNICSIATYDTLFDGSRIGRIRIVSPGAIWQSFRFTNFYLSEGCEVYIYNDEKTYTRGAFTSRNNKPFGGLYISTTVGSSHIIEIYETAGAFGLSAMLIDRVYQGYYPISTFAFSLPKSKENSETILRKFGGSEIECNTNVNCNNDYWCVEKYAVCVIEDAQDQDVNICTGTLLNNSAEDFKPYILTAWHCLDDPKNCVISSEEENTNYMAFVFNWWSNDCNNGTEAQANSNVGNKVYSSAITRALYRETDMALLEIRTENDGGEFQIPPSEMLYYAGWSRKTELPISGTVIHHPAGDIMKVSFIMNDTNQYPQYLFHSPARGHRCHDGNFSITSADESTNYLGCYMGYEGSTEGGSSGAALLNEKMLVIGQLSSNNQFYCWQQFDKGPQFNSFGKISISWNGGGTNATRLSNWLYPGINPPFELAGIMSNSPVELYNRYTEDDEKQLEISIIPDGVAYYHAPTEIRLGGGKSWTTPPLGAINNHSFQFHREYGGDVSAVKRIVLKECLWVPERDGANQKVRFHIGMPQCTIGESAFTPGNPPVKIIMESDAGYSTGTSCDRTTAMSPNEPSERRVIDATYNATSIVPKMSLAPNPAFDYIDIRIEGEKSGDLMLINSLGTRLHVMPSKLSQSALILTARYELANLPAGMYIVMAQSGGQVLTQTFMIIR